MRDLTADERRAIDALERIARCWPPSLKLFSAAGTLLVVDGIADEVNDRLDPDAVLATISGIPNEGGDTW